MLNDLSARLLSIATIETVYNTQQQYSHTHKTVAETNIQLTGLRAATERSGAGERAIGLSV